MRAEQGNLANKPVLEWLPSFGPMQFAAGGSFGHSALRGLLLGLVWAAGFTVCGLILFHIKTQPKPLSMTRRTSRTERGLSLVMAQHRWRPTSHAVPSSS